MIGWVEGIQNAIEYIEEHLTEELDIQEIARKSVCFGVSLSKNLQCTEWVHCRRVYPESQA